jgi:hypothetical protein
MILSLLTGLGFLGERGHHLLSKLKNVCSFLDLNKSPIKGQLILNKIKVS